jgi:hypothetical protein
MADNEIAKDNNRLCAASPVTVSVLAAPVAPPLASAKTE